MAVGDRLPRLGVKCTAGRWTLEHCWHAPTAPAGRQGQRAGSLSPQPSSLALSEAPPPLCACELASPLLPSQVADAHVVSKPSFSSRRWNAIVRMPQRGARWALSATQLLRKTPALLGRLTGQLLVGGRQSKGRR